LANTNYIWSSFYNKTHSNSLLQYLLYLLQHSSHQVVRQPWPIAEEIISINTRNKAEKDICRTEKVMLGLTFNPALALTGFRTVLPCFQQVIQTWPRDPIENPALGQQSTSKNTWPQWAINRDTVTWYWSANTLFWHFQVDIVRDWVRVCKLWD